MFYSAKIPQILVPNHAMTQTPLDHYHLSPADLTHRTDPATLPKSSKSRLAKSDPAFGQERAVKAINTALDVPASGYHVFAVGDTGLGKRTLITRLLTERAKREPTPKDWVYVHNFADARRPIAIEFDTAKAEIFRQKVHKLWQKAKKKLIAKLLGDRHQAQIEQIKATISTTQNGHYDRLNTIAKTHHLTLTILPDGRAKFMPIDDSQAIDNKVKNELIKELNHAHLELEELEDKIHQQLDELNQSSALAVLEPLFAPLLREFADNPKATAHLHAMRDDMVYHVARIVGEDDDEFVNAVLGDVPSRYMVNVVVSHKQNSGSPIVFEELPTHLNLLGHTEYTTELGTVYCDVSMIRAGALHRANGGYLLLEASHLLEHPYAWQGLKRALQSGQLRISSLEQLLTLTGSLSLEPDNIPLDVKVILLGEAELYYELLEYEPEFASVFKIRADFHHATARTPDSELALVKKMVDIIKEHRLTPFDNTAFARLLDECSRLADDKYKLDLHTSRLSGLIFETARHAVQAGSTIATADHVRLAISDRHDRHGYLQELYTQEIRHGHQLITTTGQGVGQLNALTVISDTDSEFGLPARLTALITPRFGNGDILDIERDVELGGSLHAKGVLIMTNYLRSLFANSPMNFSASLAFEQSYAHIDGDSATLAECCVLLSALADVPLAQNIAITGSMNQLGQAQAIGGVNEKITGFFDICSLQGLDGTQGVIIPRTNVRQLMLRDDIVQAVSDGRFHVYAIDSLKDALVILTGMPIDDKNKNGDYKKNTLFGKIVSRLVSWDDEKDENDKGKKTGK